MRASLATMASGLLLLASTAGATPVAQLSTLQNATIQAIQINENVDEAPNEASLTFAEGSQPPQCLFGAIKYDPTTDIGKAIHGMLIAARAANRPVTIGYEKTTVGPYVIVCTLRTISY